MGGAAVTKAVACAAIDSPELALSEVGLIEDSPAFCVLEEAT